VELSMHKLNAALMEDQLNPKEMFPRQEKVRSPDNDSINKKKFPSIEIPNDEDKEHDLEDELGKADEQP
jgi:hypothetical protein